MTPITIETEMGAGRRCARERCELLVVGYGNTLRQDDGVGPYVSEQVEKLGLEGVRTLALAQLNPETVEELQEALAVVFVDAAQNASKDVEIKRLSPANSCQVTTHAAEPSTLLALSRDLFAYEPQAWLLTIRTERLGFGEEFSPGALKGVAAAIAEIKRLRSALAAR